MKTSHPPNSHLICYCPSMSLKDTTFVAEACYAPDRSKATLRCNANDCIHQRSFVSYSLCSLSFLSQTPAIPWQALRCVTASISHCQRYPYQERQGVLGMTCQVLHPVSPCAFVPGEMLCPHSLICFSQPGWWCETHKHIWKNTLRI